MEQKINMGTFINNGLLTTIIIFGASGDLTQRKLMPSLFNLFRKRRTPKKFQIVGFGGTAYTDEQFREHLHTGIKDHASYSFTDDEWNIFAPNLRYISGKYTEASDFKKLAETLTGLHLVNYARTRTAAGDGLCLKSHLAPTWLQQSN